MRTVCCCLLILYGSFPFLLACSAKGKPVAWPQKTAPIYPQPRPHDCKMVMLTKPPAESYETFAQIWAYGNGQDELPRMQHLIRFEVCQMLHPRLRLAESHAKKRNEAESHGAAEVRDEAVCQRLLKMSMSLFHGHSTCEARDAGVG